MNQKTAKQLRRVAAKFGPDSSSLLKVIRGDWLQSTHKKRGAMRPKLAKAAKM